MCCITMSSTDSSDEGMQYHLRSIGENFGSIDIMKKKKFTANHLYRRRDCTKQILNVLLLPIIVCPMIVI